MQKTFTPFASHFTSQLPELLLNLNCSIALTTYQAGKVVFICPNINKEQITTLPRTFEKPMGMSVDGDKMVIALKDEVIVLENNRELAQHYPNKKNTYDSLWLPRVTFYTGLVDMHDIKLGDDGIYAVNTSFSCICKVDGNHNFKPVWKPNFIDNLAPEDRCHINGLAMVNGKPKYTTALGTTNTYQGWRKNIVEGGVLIDVETNDLILQNLPMPHSPTMYMGDLYILLSASGELIKVNVEEKSYSVIKKFDGFCRGMTIYKDYAFIGFSKLRKNSSTFAKLPFSEKANFSGVKIIHLPTQAEVSSITYTASIDEIYEVEILPNMIRPNILNTINELHKSSLSIPGTSFWGMPDQKEV